MQFFAVVILALSAVASADMIKVVRQDTSTPDASAAAMTNANGDVISFDSTAVYQAGVAAGI